MIDDIFRVLIDPYWRRVAHLEELIGVKYLNRLFPLDPEPGQPIHLILTTGVPSRMTPPAVPTPQNRHVLK
jgi:hypothetical protein